MATWKKIITSGSNAEINQITASTGFNGSGRDISFADTAMATADSLVFVDAGGGTKKDTVADIVTLLAGDGIQNSSNKFAVDVSDFAGTGLSGDGSENINIYKIYFSLIIFSCIKFIIILVIIQTTSYCGWFKCKTT